MVIPLYVLFQQIGLLDNIAALIITYVATNLPIVVWLMRDYFASLPIELEESASVDGASIYRIVRSIVLPISVPGLVATFLIVLIFAWNEFLIALVLTSANAQTMPLQVAAQNATRGPQWWAMSVLILIMITPVVVMAIAPRALYHARHPRRRPQGLIDGDRSPSSRVLDVRFPTSRTLDGSDAMNPDPDYSAAYVDPADRRRRRARGPRPDVHDRAGDRGGRRRGRGAPAARRRAVGRGARGRPGRASGGDLVGDSQLRWIGPEKGAIHLATAAVVNAVWDLFAKRAGKPLWKLLAT